MNVFETHRKVIEDYTSYIESFFHISDPVINERVQEELRQGKLWPEPLLQFNPSFEKAGTVESLVHQGLFHRDFSSIFKGYSLYTHQQEAIQLGIQGRDFVVTSGTGSGKSLTYLGSIFHHLLNSSNTDGVQAVVVYPMNALINSQRDEINKYKENFEQATGRTFPITYGQYTGQEGTEERALMQEKPPQIILTNYMMLELLLTRIKERSIRDAIFANLRFLVFDELHTYRGRQGADIAMLIRRIRARCRNEVICIGTSATMVSAGSKNFQQDEVASVASKLFGRPFIAEQVVVEKLARSLSTGPEAITREALSKSIRAGIDVEGDLAALGSNPLSVWLENAVALEDQDGQLQRAKPRKIGEVVDALVEASGEISSDCKHALISLLRWISVINKKLRDNGQYDAILPFRLHQFLSQTGSVYTTLDQDDNRFITLEPGIYKQDDANNKPIFPSVFSRASGHQFICVVRNGDQLESREFREVSEEDASVTDGYLIVGDDVWDPIEDLDSLPDSWFRRTKQGLVPDREKKVRFPIKLYFDEQGRCSETEELKWSGWFMTAPLLFDPTGGVFFDSRTGEGTKLSKLGSEGRSTSTTITAFSILNQLDASGYHPKDQKLLSFTDNRQDAALQAGHFNDFVQTVRIRAAICKALCEAPRNTLSHATLGEAVYRALGLGFTDFASLDKEPEFPSIRHGYESALQTLVLYRALGDLRRSWKIVLPNLEQCALLAVEYEHLSEVAESDLFWGDVPILNKLNPKERQALLETILDFFRHEYAIHSESYLKHEKVKENEQILREKLKAPWALDRHERLYEPFHIRTQKLAQSKRRDYQSIGPASSVGKYIKQFVKLKSIPVDLSGAMYTTFIEQLLAKLDEATFLRAEKVRNANNKEVPVYRLKIEKIIWRLGDGETVKPDLIKQRSYRDRISRPNEFFKGLYQRDLSQMKRIRGEDHTGQLSSDLRMDREELFKAGQVNALFCSPTMELGVDIGGLSVVHLRNAPPNPANYAQRAGRAGRSGQGALVFTYCSSYSPHDRHYFNKPLDLVAGSVQAPRLDLCNEELLLSHLNALVISEIGLPQIEQEGEAKASLMRLVGVESKGLPLADEVRSSLKMLPKAEDEVRATFRRVIADFLPTLETRGKNWFTSAWVDIKIAGIANALDDALERWRVLSNSAQKTLTAASHNIASGFYSASSPEYKKHRKTQDQANRQLDLLRNNTGKGRGELSEFYPYRYLASEGFLPGYNFTRLPVRVFLPTGDSSGEFVSRPRSVALTEFGPLNIIYHNGQKYRVAQLVTQDLEASLTEARISTKTGYFLRQEQKDLEICPFSGLSLSDNANKEHLHDLLEMTESRAVETDRISCEEEERRRQGFEVSTYFTVDGGDFSRVRKSALKLGQDAFMNLRYIPAARLIHLNRQWRNRSSQGFPIGLVSGDWNASVPDPVEQREEFKIVKLWTSSVADAIYIEPTQPLGLEREGILTLQYALKRAIEEVFQVEPKEISVVAVGDQKAPNILIYEAAEGSLGVLSQFVDDVTVFHQVVAKAFEVCRYQDETYKAKASYDDLLSYYNQRDHKELDRWLIKTALEKLLVCSIEQLDNSNYQSYDEHYEALLRTFDPNSSTERKFLQYLYSNGLRLPDEAQKQVDGLYVQPDFYYQDRFWVFCDGTPHDEPSIKAADKAKRQEIMARGDEVWVYYYRDNLVERINSRPDIFRKVR
jgi:superfamily II DNA/RNA helicase